MFHQHIKILKKNNVAPIHHNKMILQLRCITKISHHIIYIFAKNSKCLILQKKNSRIQSIKANTRLQNL